MNVFPIFFLFSSGSITPFRLSRNLFEASTTCRSILKCELKVSSTCFLSPFRRNPLSTNKHLKFFPRALLSNKAVTEESTPPLKPQITFPSPTSSLILITASLTKDFGVQSPLHFAILNKKFRRIFFPSSV